MAVEAADMDVLMKALGIEDFSASLLNITDYLLKNDYAKTYEVLRKEGKRLSGDLTWNKRVAVLLTENFSKDTPWSENEQEGVYQIMEYLIEQLKNVPENGFSSSSIFLCIFEGNKKILQHAKMWNYRFQAKLIDSVLNVTFPGTKSSNTSSFRISMYATCWNKMRDHLKTSPAESNLEKMMTSLRWLLSDSVPNLSKLAAKLQKNVTWAFHSNVHENEELLSTLLYDLAGDFKKIIDKDAANGEFNGHTFTGYPSVQHSVAEFTFAALTFAFYCKNSELAEAIVDRISNACSRHIHTTFLNVLTTFAQLTVLLVYGDRGPEQVSDLAPKMKKFRISFLSTIVKVEGGAKLIETLMNSFLQTIAHPRPWCSKAWEKISVDTVAKILAELLRFLPANGLLTLAPRVKVEIKLEPEAEIEFLLFLIRVIADKLKQGAYSKVLPIQKCMDLLTELVPKYESQKASTDLNTRIGNSFHALAVALQHVGRFEESLAISRKCVESFASIPPEKLPMHPNFYCNIMSETLSKLKEHRKGLEWLGQWLIKQPATLDERIGAFDFFDTPCFNEWGTQWVRLKHEAQSSEIQQITTYDILMETPAAEELIPAALLLELNSYFTCKFVLSDAIICVGERLEEIGRNECEIALGYVAQAIGLSWDIGDTNESFCIDVCKKALQVLEDAAEAEAENPQVLILSAVCKAWLALTLSKYFTTIVKKDLDFIQEEEKKAAAGKKNNKGGESPPLTEATATDDRAVPGITSINLSHEYEVATLIISCIDSLYTVTQYDEADMKKWFDICPALILLTARLCAYRIGAYGDTYTSIRAWHVCYVLAKLYNRRCLQLISGVEVYKLMPQSTQSMITELEQVNESGKESSAQYMSKAFFSQIDLCRAITALKEKQYEEGVKILAKVLEHPKEKSNLDITHLFMAEAYHVVAHYRLAQESNEFSMDGIEPNLATMSPAALMCKSYKLCCGLPRKHQPHSSGWQDLCFNQHLLFLMLNNMTETIRVLKDAGTIKELLSYGADMIHFTQSYGYVSRAVEVLVVLAELDISAREFRACDQKLSAINRLLSISDASSGIHRVEMSKTELTEVYKKLELNADHMIPIVMPNTKIIVPPIELPKTEGPDAAMDIFPDPVSPTIVTRKIRFPRLLFHSISCSCYVCTHPTIIPTTLKYLHILARYVVYGDDPKTALNLFANSKVHHVKACVRIFYHFERMCLRLAQGFQAKKVGRDALQRAYMPFIVQPAFHLLYTLAEVHPASQFEFIAECCQNIQDGLSMINETSKIAHLTPLEIIFSCVYEYCASVTGAIDIKNSDIRDRIVEEDEELDDSDDPSSFQGTIVLDSD